MEIIATIVSRPRPRLGIMFDLSLSVGLEVEGVNVEERDGAQPEGLEGVETVSCTCRIRPSAPINLGATRAQFSDLRARTRS